MRPASREDPPGNGELSSSRRSASACSRCGSSEPASSPRAVRPALARRARPQHPGKEIHPQSRSRGHGFDEPALHRPDGNGPIDREGWNAGRRQSYVASTPCLFSPRLSPPKEPAPDARIRPRPLCPLSAPPTFGQRRRAAAKPYVARFGYSGPGKSRSGGGHYRVPLRQRPAGCFCFRTPPNRR